MKLHTATAKSPVESLSINSNYSGIRRAHGALLLVLLVVVVLRIRRERGGGGGGGGGGAAAAAAPARLGVEHKPTGDGCLSHTNGWKFEHR